MGNRYSSEANGVKCNKCGINLPPNNWKFIEVFKDGANHTFCFYEENQRKPMPKRQLTPEDEEYIKEEFGSDIGGTAIKVYQDMSGGKERYYSEFQVNFAKRFVGEERFWRLAKYFERDYSNVPEHGIGPNLYFRNQHSNDYYCNECWVDKFPIRAESVREKLATQGLVLSKKMENFAPARMLSGHQSTDMQVHNNQSRIKMK